MSGHFMVLDNQWKGPIIFTFQEKQNTTRNTNQDIVFAHWLKITIAFIHHGKENEWSFYGFSSIGSKL